MNNQELVGRKIKEAREKAGLTQEELGRKTGYSAMGISYFEKGLRGIKISDLEVLSKALGVDVHFFLDVFQPSKSSPVTFLRGGGYLTDEEKDETKKTIDDFESYIRKTIIKDK